MLGYMVNLSVQDCLALSGIFWHCLACCYGQILCRNRAKKLSAQHDRHSRRVLGTAQWFSIFLNISRLRVPAVSFFHIFPANQSTVSSGIVSTCLLTNRQPAHFDCTASTCLTGLLNNSTNRCVNNVCMYNRYWCGYASKQKIHG